MSISTFPKPGQRHEHLTLPKYEPSCEQSQVAGQMMSDPEVSRGVTGMIETLGQRAGGTRADQSEQSPQAGGGGADAGGGFGAIMQSLGPMMQQLAVGAGQSQGTG